MVGIFDSGRGGELALRELRKISPSADVAFLADRKNAPYGTKSRRELIELVKRDIDVLREHGASDVLMACCTASTVYSELPYEYRMGVIPIIDAAAMAAVGISCGKRVGVMCTEATARSDAFATSIRRLCGEAVVVTRASQCLVCAVESGCFDELMLDRELSHLHDVDTIILGCTHFAAFESNIRNRGFATVNTARIGAELLAERATCGGGATLYINK